MNSTIKLAFLNGLSFDSYWTWLEKCIAQVHGDVLSFRETTVLIKRKTAILKRKEVLQ